MVRDSELSGLVDSLRALDSLRTLKEGIVANLRGTSPAFGEPPAVDTPLAQAAGQYREWQPVSALRDHLSRLWVNDLSRSSALNFHVVPDGSVDIFWTGGSLWVAGPDTRPILELVRPGYKVVGARFRPGMAYAWLGAPLSEVRNARVPLEEFWKQDAGLLADCLFASPGSTATTAALQRALLARLPQVGKADPRIEFLRRSAGTLHEDLKVGGIREVARQSGMSERTLHRHCTDIFGYGFKTLQRILRFQRLFRLAALYAGSNLAELAIQAGYADQPHMSREVRRLCDATPAELVAELSR